MRRQQPVRADDQPDHKTASNAGARHRTPLVVVTAQRGGAPKHMTDETDETNDETDNGFYTHDDWEYGFPCPECGNERMYVVQVSGEYYLHEDGTESHVDWTPYCEELMIECDDCHTLLQRHPAMDELNAV